MAQRSNVFTKAQVVLSSSTDTVDFENGDNVSGSVKSVELSRTFDMLDDTVMGETARSRKAGLGRRNRNGRVCANVCSWWESAKH